MIVRSTSPVASPSRSLRVRAASRDVAPVPADANAIQPVAAIQYNGVSTQRSFAGELLRLGIEQGVEGLVQKAGGRDSYEPPRLTPYDLYEQAQVGFKDPHILRWRI